MVTKGTLLWCISYVDLDNTTLRGKKGSNGPDSIPDYEPWKQRWRPGEQLKNRAHTTQTYAGKAMEIPEGSCACKITGTSSKTPQEFQTEITAPLPTAGKQQEADLSKLRYGGELSDDAFYARNDDSNNTLTRLKLPKSFTQIEGNTPK